MQSKKLKQYFKAALEGKWAIGQFNISNIETLKGIFEAAKNLKSPVIIGTSEGESRFLGLRQARALVSLFEEETGVSAALNLDHGKTFDYIKKAIAAGYDSVHFDGSALPLSQNIALTRRVVKYAAKFGVLVEGEVGMILGSSKVLKKLPESKIEDLTDPIAAKNFIDKTGVDSLAINIGTFHGIMSSGRNPRINIARLKEIREALGERACLVLHGGSGTPSEDVKAAIKLGIVKVNINTELRKAFTGALKILFEKKSEEIAPYKYLPEAILAVQRTVEEKIKLLGSINKISDEG
ncbi:MAG: class II fructose-bisphosphate aldolase [bacterium]|nr:class II fructose-bisphosphate aldolase [bacterium]